MDGSVGVVEWPILVLEGSEGWEWVRFSRRMGGKEGHPKKMEGTQVCTIRRPQMRPGRYSGSEQALGLIKECS